MVTAPYGGLLLADMGAEVIKVEATGAGDPARQYGPFPDGIPDPEKSGLFFYLNRNKQSVTLDLTVPSGRALLDGLLAPADIVIENLGDRRWGEIGLSRE